MPRKSTMAVEADEPKTPVKSYPELVRVEDSIERFIEMMLPSVPDTKVQICPLWTAKTGKSFFRCKYWKYIVDGFLVTRKEMLSKFVSVEIVNGKRVLQDYTTLPSSPQKGLGSGS